MYLPTQDLKTRPQNSKNQHHIAMFQDLDKSLKRSQSYLVFFFNVRIQLYSVQIIECAVPIKSHNQFFCSLQHNINVISSRKFKGWSRLYEKSHFSGN